MTSPAGGDPLATDDTTAGPAGSASIAEGISQSDAAILVGLTLEQAETVAGDKGWVTRVVARDGVPLPVTADHVANRVGLWLLDNVVARVDVG